MYFIVISVLIRENPCTLSSSSVINVASDNPRIFTHFITHFTDLLFVLIYRLPQLAHQSFAEYPCPEFLGIAVRVSSKMRTLFYLPWRRILLLLFVKHLIRPS